MDFNQIHSVPVGPEKWFNLLKQDRNAYLKHILFLAGVIAEPENGEWSSMAMTFSIRKRNVAEIKITGPSGDYIDIDLPVDETAARIAQFRAELLFGIEYIMRVTAEEEESEL